MVYCQTSSRTMHTNVFSHNRFNFHIVIVCITSLTWNCSLYTNRYSPHLREMGIINFRGLVASGLPWQNGICRASDTLSKALVSWMKRPPFAGLVAQNTNLKSRLRMCLHTIKRWAKLVNNFLKVAIIQLSGIV